MFVRSAHSEARVLMPKEGWKLHQEVYEERSWHMQMGDIKLGMVTKETMHEQLVLRNLLKMYCYEWSQYNTLEVNADGNFAFETCVSDYWTKEGYHALLISVHGTWAGFVLFDKEGLIVHKDYDYSLAEFFVMYTYRRGGVGRYVAKYLFDSFPGTWEIGYHPKNTPSVYFWDKVVNEYTNGAYEVRRSCPENKYHDGTLGDVLSFNSCTSRMSER